MAAEALWEAAGWLLGATTTLLEVALVLFVVAHVVLPLLRAYFAGRAAGLTVYAGAAALTDAIAARCPALFDPKRRGFQPTWWLFNGHLQTGYTALLGEDDSSAVTYERYVYLCKFLVAEDSRPALFLCLGVGPSDTVTDAVASCWRRQTAA